VHVHGDRGRIEQALMNLVVNARDAMEGAGRITVSTTRAPWPGGTTTCGARLEAGVYAVLCVVDEGPGVELHARARLFEPFYTTKGAAGTGLGLPIVADVAHAAGGGVVVEEASGRGTSFRLLLPIAPIGADAV
jgi:signal transduction histidine kinase